MISVFATGFYVVVECEKITLTKHKPPEAKSTKKIDEK